MGRFSLRGSPPLGESDGRRCQHHASVITFSGSWREVWCRSSRSRSAVPRLRVRPPQVGRAMKNSVTRTSQRTVGSAEPAAAAGRETQKPRGSAQYPMGGVFGEIAADKNGGPRVAGSIDDRDVGELNREKC